MFENKHIQDVLILIYIQTDVGGHTHARCFDIKLHSLVVEQTYARYLLLIYIQTVVSKEHFSYNIANESKNQLAEKN